MAKRASKCSSKLAATDKLNSCTACADGQLLAFSLIHAGGGLRDIGEGNLEEWGNSIVDLGSAGVYVFFVISGFAVANSWQQSSAAGGTYGAYLIQRLARIAPLYYFYILIYIWADLTSPGWQGDAADIDAYNVLAHLTFLSAFDGSIADSIIGVEWTLAIEVFYYLLIPGLVVLFIRKPLTGPVVLFAGAVIWELLPIVLRYVGFADYSDLQLWLFTPLPWIWSFVLGVLAFQYRDSRHLTKAQGAWPLLFAAAWVALWVGQPELRSAQLLGVNIFDRYLWVSFLTAVLILLLKNDSVPVKFLFANPFITLVGSLSYGIYLSHALILRLDPLHALSDLSRFLVTLGLSILASLGTWLVIEYPSINKAKKALATRKS